MQTRRVSRLVILGVFLTLVVACGWRALAAFPTPLRVPARRGLVASDQLQASRAGAEVLAEGGNAVDAAVATALALGVVGPAGSGLGGGGFLVYWDARHKRAYVLDFRETAP